jgi:hypothetical protein
MDCFIKKLPMNLGKKKSSNGAPPLVPYLKWRSHFTIHRGEMLFTQLSSFLPSFLPLAQM